MVNMSINDFEEDIVSIIEQVIKSHKPVTVATNLGNVVVLCEEEYNKMLAKIDF